MSVHADYDIKKALELTKPSKYRYSKYSKMYIFTTENISGYYRKLSFKNKSVLTVASSLDHSLNAVLKGAIKITNFDINKLAYYISNLKLGAVKALSYEEFIQFFKGDNPFSYDLFKIIRNELNPSVIKFYEKIYKEFEYNGKLLKESYLFHKEYERHIEYNDYLLPSNYYLLKSKLKTIEINFINASVTSLTKYIKNQKYDLILLSNISDYIKSIFKRNYLYKYFAFIKDNLSLLLKKNGLIITAYIYDYKEKSEGRSDIDIAEKREEVLTNEFKIIEFKGAISGIAKDAVIIYKGGIKDGK